MIIVDTSIWIDLFRGNRVIIKQVDLLIDSNSILGLEPVFAELLQGAKSEFEIEFINKYWQDLNRTEEKGLWLEAGYHSSKYRWKANGVSLIDAFIIAVAWKHDYKIWTLDKKLAQAAGKKFIYQ